MHPYYALPNFVDNMPLSERAIDTLAAAVDELRSRGVSLAAPQHGLMTQSSLTKEGWLIHFHDAVTPANEYLYYDIEVVHEAWPSHANPAASIYWHDMATPLFTITDTEARYRGVVALQNKPTAGTHPDDADPTPVRVKVVPGVGWAVTVHDLEEIRLPGGYTAMNDAVALTDGQQADVAEDLQALADNVSALLALSESPLPGFRSYQMSNNAWGFETTGGTTYWRTNLGDKLHFRIGLWRSTDDVADLVFAFTVNGAALAQTLTLKRGRIAVDENGASTAFDYDTGSERPYVFEGYLDLSGVARAQNQRCSVQTDIVFAGTGDVGAMVYYLGEGL